MERATVRIIEAWRHTDIFLSVIWLRFVIINRDNYEY